MPSINLDLDYFDHPKVMKLIGLLGRGAEVLPIRLWCYCGKFHAASGDLVGYSAQQIELTLRWWGEQGRCVTAMIDAGFMRSVENGFTVHDWDTWQGHIHASREKGKRMAKARWDRLKGHDPTENDAYSNAQAMHKHYTKQCQGNAGQGNARQGEDNCPASTPQSAEIAQRFFFGQIGGKESEYKIAEVIGEMVRVGYSESVIAAEVGDPLRDKSERFFKIKDRLEKKRPKRTKTEAQIDARQAAIDAETESLRKEHEDRLKAKGSG